MYHLRILSELNILYTLNMIIIIIDNMYNIQNSAIQYIRTTRPRSGLVVLIYLLENAYLLSKSRFFANNSQTKLLIAISSVLQVI